MAKACAAAPCITPSRRTHFWAWRVRLRSTGSFLLAIGFQHCGRWTSTAFRCRGELYDVPLATIRDQFIPAEPAELELGVVELENGEPALAVVLRREVLNTPALIDISDRGGWRGYLSQVVVGQG
jgi:hypothetical protein